MSVNTRIRVTHLPSHQTIAEGPLGWGITRFEGNLYIGRKYLKTDGFRINFIPGLCIYKLLYVWLDFTWGDKRSRNLGWMYWLPNPLFPFIWFRVAVPAQHPELRIDVLPVDAEAAPAEGELNKTST